LVLKNTYKGNQYSITPYRQLQLPKLTNENYKKLTEKYKFGQVNMNLDK